MPQPSDVFDINAELEAYGCGHLAVKEEPVGLLQEWFGGPFVCLLCGEKSVDVVEYQERNNDRWSHNMFGKLVTVAYAPRSVRAKYQCYSCGATIVVDR